jgi:hypothetical protein
MAAKKKYHLVLDANVLIDFYKCDKTIIKLICNYVGQIYLATPVLSEFNEINGPVEHAKSQKHLFDDLAHLFVHPLMIIYFDQQKYYPTNPEPALFSHQLEGYVVLSSLLSPPAS